MEIGGVRITLHEKPFVVAELSGNHNQSLDRALAIVDAAASAELTGDQASDIHSRDDHAGPFFTRVLCGQVKPALESRKNLRSLCEAHTPWEWHLPIMERARERGLLCFSSAFDFTSVDFLEKLDTPAYKIASYECVDCRW